MRSDAVLLSLAVLIAIMPACVRAEDQDDSELDWFSTDCAADIAAGEELGITEIPDDVARYRRAYCKYTSVVAPNGKPIHIFAQNEITNEQLIFAREILGFYLEDVPGSEYGADKSAIADKMTENDAVLVMRNGYDGKYWLGIRGLGLGGQPLYDEEVIPVSTAEYIDLDNFRDATFEEVLHLVHDNGIGIDIRGYPEDAAPEFQAELRKALNHAHYEDRLWGHGNERRARWIAELKFEGSLTQEYLAAIVDSYYGLWGGNRTRDTGIGGYVAKTRETIAERDPMGYTIMEKFFNPYLTIDARIDSGFEGTFSLALDPEVRIRTSRNTS